MPLYEDKHNAENKIRVSPQAMEQAWFGTDCVVDQLAELIAGGKKRIALDGWYGVDFLSVADRLCACLRAHGIKAEMIASHTLFYPSSLPHSRRR